MKILNWNSKHVQSYVQQNRTQFKNLHKYEQYIYTEHFDSIIKEQRDSTQLL